MRKKVSGAIEQPVAFFCRKPIERSEADVVALCKKGFFLEAKQLFGIMPSPGVATWTATIAIFIKQGHQKEALHLFRQMQMEGIKPDAITFMTIANSCSLPSALAQGKMLHACFNSSGLELIFILATAVIRMYGKCASLKDARSLFEQMVLHDVFSWTAIITAYAQHGFQNEAWQLFRRMQLEGAKPNNFTLLAVLITCSSPAALAEGKLVHAFVVECGYGIDIVLGSALVCMYGRCGSLEGAQATFNKMDKVDLITWNSMISAYIQHEHDWKARQLFWQMIQKQEANEITFSTILDAYSDSYILGEGKLVHAHSIIRNLNSDMIVQNALITMYNKCRSLTSAHSIFIRMPNRSSISWTLLLVTYLENGYAREARQLFQQMQSQGVQLDEITFVTVITICTMLGDLMESRLAHASIIDCGFDSDLILTNALINMYGKVGTLEEAQCLFKGMHQKSLASWNAMLVAYNDHGKGMDAIELFEKMKTRGVAPNEITFLVILTVCAGLASSMNGKLVHMFIIDLELESVILKGALINVYGRCGELEAAQQIFDGMHYEGVVPWSALIAAYAHNGQGRRALELFQQMQVKHTMPDKISFISILIGCSYAGLLEDGCYIFTSISQCGTITLCVEHCCCIIDLLCRAGWLEEALEFIMGMAFKSDVKSWMTLLSASRMYDDMRSASSAMKYVLELDPNSSSAFVQMSNMHATISEWDDFELLIELFSVEDSINS